jgi:hypothetical protein
VWGGEGQRQKSVWSDGRGARDKEGRVKLKLSLVSRRAHIAI